MNDDAHERRTAPWVWILVAVAFAAAIGGIAFDLLVSIHGFDGWLLVASVSGGFAALKSLHETRDGQIRRALAWGVVAAILLLPGGFAIWLMIRGFGVPA